MADNDATQPAGPWTKHKNTKVAATGGGKMSTSSTAHASLFELQKDNNLLSSPSPGDIIARRK
jgi:hypothetical protein